MKKHSLKLALLCGMVVTAVSLGAPAYADNICAILTDNTGTAIGISDVGTAPILICHGRDQGGICDEAFSVCTTTGTGAGTFEVGAVGVTGVNLLPSPSGTTNNPFNFCRPFIQTVVGMQTVTHFLTPDGTISGIPFFNLSLPEDLDNNPNTPDVVPPLGTLVQVILENQPTNGKCIGVRTTIQTRIGTCKLWKIRKLFNACTSNRRITFIKEFELPCACGTFARSASDSLAAVASLPSTGEFITLASAGNTGASRITAGSVEKEEGFPREFNECRIVPGFKPVDDPMTMVDETTFFTTTSVDSCENQTLRYLEVVLDFTPGFVELKPRGQAGSEKFVTFHVDIE